MGDLVQVTTTVGTEAAARKLANQLVAERLAACAQVLGPITSTYWWKGNLETASEWLCIAKTTRAACERLMGRVREVHPYEQPEILATPASEVDPGYAAWVASEVR